MTSCMISGIPTCLFFFHPPSIKQTKQTKADYGIKMSSFLLVLSLIAGAIPVSKEAGNDSLDKLDAPYVRNYPCHLVQDKKPWCACRSTLSSDVVDLSSLGTEEGSANREASSRPPKFISNEINGWRIAWTPCEDFDLFTNITLHPDIGEMACKGVGFARYTETSANICQGYGSHGSSARFYSNGYGPKTKDEKFYIEFVFSTPNEVRNGRIWLRCTPDSDKNTLTYHGDHKGIEDVEFSSKCNCPNKQCTGTPGKPYHLGGGAKAGIVIGAIAFIALIAFLGVLYRRRHQVPHPVQVEHDERHPILL